MKLVELNNHSIVVIDEAYGAFGNLLVDDEVINHTNMVVFRSFSKDYGMAGNRIGYCIASTQIIDKVKNFSQWANVSYLSVGAAIAALEHEEYFTELRNAINQRRDRFTAFLQKQKFTTFPSHINAALLQFQNEAEANAFVQHLTNHHVVISHGNGASNIGLDKSFVRIAIGTDEQMEKIQEIILSYTKI